MAEDSGLYGNERKPRSALVDNKRISGVSPERVLRSREQIEAKPVQQHAGKSA